MLSDPIEFYDLLDTLEISEPNLFVDHVEQVTAAMQAYQLEYNLTDQKVIKILNTVGNRFTNHGQRQAPQGIRSSRSLGTPIN